MDRSGLFISSPPAPPITAPRWLCCRFGVNLIWNERNSLGRSIRTIVHGKAAKEHSTFGCFSLASASKEISEFYVLLSWILFGNNRALLRTQLQLQLLGSIYIKYASKEVTMENIILARSAVVLFSYRVPSRFCWNLKQAESFHQQVEATPKLTDRRSLLR